MFNSIDHQEYANQNHTEISSLTGKNGYHQRGKKDNVLVMVGRKGNPSLYNVVKCNLVHPLQKTVWRCLKKLKIKLPHNPAIPILDIRE